MLPPRLKQSGLPAFAALPALLWLAATGTVLQALALLLLLAGLRKEYYRASRAIFTLLHRPLLYLFQYSGSRVYLHSRDGGKEILGSFGSDQAVALVNHRGDLDWLVGLHVLDAGGGVGACKAIIKKSLLAVPFFGFIWWAVDFICISRNWASASKMLEQGYKSQHEYEEAGVPYSLTIFPEGTRLTAKKLQDSQAFAKSRNLPVLEHCLCPRVKGVWSAINTLHLDAVYDCTIVAAGSHGSKANMLSLARGEPVELHVFVEKIVPVTIPKDEDGLSKWLFQRWQAKDGYLKRFDKDGHLGIDGNVKHELAVRPSAGHIWLGAFLWWLLSMAVFVQWTLANGYYRLLGGLFAGLILMVVGLMAVLHVVHFKKEGPDEGKKDSKDS